MATATKTKASKNNVTLPAWQTEEAVKLQNRKVKAFLTKHGDSPVLSDLQELLRLCQKLNGYRSACQAIVAHKPVEVETEEEDEEEE